MLKPYSWMVGLLAAWILWCVFVIEILVPAVQRHVTMWAQLIAIVFCLLPIVVAATLFVLRLKKATDSN